MPRRVLLFLVPLLTVAIVALGLRVGAKDEVTAAIVHGAPLPRDGGRFAWSLSTFREASGVREVVALPFHAVVRARGTTVRIDGATNEDGAAELGATIPGLGAGDPIALEITDDQGEVLAAGDATGLDALPTRAEHRELVHATVDDGDLTVKIAVWGTRIATASSGTLWITAEDRAGKRVHLLRAELEPDPAVTVLDPLRLACGDTAGTLRVVPNMHVAPIDLRVTDDHGRTGRFSGTLPTAPGALFVDAPPRAPVGPVTFTLTAPNARTVAYVEIDDEVGRVHGEIVALARRGDQGASATVTTPPLAAGLHWIVVAGEPDGAEKMNGTTRAFPLRVGALASDACDEPFAGRTPTTLPRFVALDGFARARIPAQARRAKGRKIVLGAVSAGLLLELFLLVMAIRGSKPALVVEAEDKPLLRSRTESAIVLVLLSALGFLLLFALLESQTR
jgi:hypothetical protein